MEIWYIDFNESPLIEGDIVGINSNTRENLKRVIGEMPTNYKFTNSGLLLLTIDEWKEVSKIQHLKFDTNAAAIFPLKPSVSFVISTFYKDIKISQRGSNI